MKRLTRLAVAGGSAAAALALAGSAMAAYTTPRILVTGDTIAVTQSKDDDGTAKVTIYIPTGYTFQTAPPPGTQLGNVEAQVQAKAISPDAIVPVTGTIVADNPANPAYQAPQSIGCRGATTQLTSVFVLNLSAAGQTLVVPMYVSPPAAGETAFASAKFQVCLPSSDIPQAQGGAALGAKLISAILRFNAGFFTKPSAEARWRAVWTPYTVGTATVNALATVETQSLEAGAGRATIRATYNRARKRATVTGAVTPGTVGAVGIPVQILRNGRRIATVRTVAGGRYALNTRIVRRGTYTFQARVTVATRDLGAAGCTQTLPPVPCINAQQAGWSAQSAVARLRVR